MRTSSLLASVLVTCCAGVIAAACSDDVSTRSGELDAAISDAGAADTSPTPTDATTSTDAAVPADAWLDADAGNADAGNADAGNADAGNADAGNADASVEDASDASGAIDSGAIPQDGSPDAALDSGIAWDGGITAPDAGPPACSTTADTLYDAYVNPNAPSTSIASVLTTATEVIFGIRPGGGAAGGTVLACPKAGCGPQNSLARVVTTGVDKPAFLALGGVGGQTLFIGDISGNGTGAATDKVYACAVSGCGANPVVLKGGIQGMAGMVHVGGKLFWHSTIGASQFISGYDTVTSSDIPSFPNAGALIGLTEGGNALFASNQYTPASIRRFDLPSGAVTQLLGEASLGGGAHRYGLTWAAGDLYWATSLGGVTSSNGQPVARGVYRMSDTGQNLTLLAPTQYLPGGLVVDAARQKLYMTTYNSFPGVLLEVNIATGQTRDLATFSPAGDMAPYQRHIDQDSKCVYWGSYGGSVWKVAK